MQGNFYALAGFSFGPNWDNGRGKADQMNRNAR